MNHAIVIKPKNMAQKLFTLSYTSPSYTFEVNYIPALLKSASTRGVFDWVNGEVSEIDNVKGSLGSLHPTQMMLTKKLHSIRGFDHTYELVMKHSAQGYGQNVVYFVFFLQGSEQGPENALDLFLEKKSQTFDAGTFLQSAFQSNSNNAYYQTEKTKQHVFIFPTVLSVKNKSLHAITGTPKPASQVYQEILLRDFVLESNKIPLKYDKERMVEPISQDIQIIASRKEVKEGFGIPIDGMTCYPVDEGDNSYAQVVIGSGDFEKEGGKSVQALEDTSMIFGYGLLFLLLVMTIGPFGSFLLAQSCIVKGGIVPNIRWISYFLFAGCLSVGMAIPIAKLGNNDKMKISAASANLIGFIFIFIYIILWFSMGLTWTLQKSFSDTLTENIKSCVRNENGIYLFLSIIVGPLIFIDPASAVS
jgi:hypothetical protein